MKKNRLGQSELYISEIGFGCMSLDDDESMSIRLLHKAVDEGINFFDTADLYQHGYNEELVGKAFQGKKRNDVVLATKVGNRWNTEGTDWSWDASKAYIKQAAYESLKRLQTDYIDLYQLHGGTLEDPIDETIEAFEELKQEGVIRYYGISSIRPNVIREYVRRSSIVSVMLQYSILDRRPEEEILGHLQAGTISVIARGPLARGILSDRSKPITEGYLDYEKEELIELIAKLKDHIQPNQSLTHTALRYPLQHPAVATIIPGASKIEQLLQNVSVAKLPKLSEQDYLFIRTRFKQNIYKLHR